MNRRNVKRNLDTKIDTKIDPKNQWYAVLQDVAKEIQNTEKRLSDLQQSAQIITGKIKAGEPFPALPVENQ
jgi:hypothetical protein